MANLNSAKNFQFSIKKYVIDNLKTISGIDVYFDKKYIETHLPPSDKIKKWVIVDFDSTSAWGCVRNSLLNIYIHTREDSEGDVLSQLEDTVMGYFEGTENIDNQKRIPLYDAYQAQPWPVLGYMLASPVNVTGTYHADDYTKFKMIAVVLKWGV